MGWKHYQTVDHPNSVKAQVGRGLFDMRLLIFHFKFHQIFNISYFSQFNLFFEKNISFPKCPKITQKFTQNRQTVVMGISREI